MKEGYIVAQKIRSGQPVADSYLYGGSCVQMQDEYGITDAELAPYRSALFFADKKICGEAKAVERERARKELNEKSLLRPWQGERGNRHVPEFGGAL